MHMADALVVPAVAGTMYACSGLVAAYSGKKITLENEPKKIPVMGVMGAFVFATQMVNFSIPGTASSGHLCGAILLTALLGPYAAFLSMIGVLLIQCLMFADGGILALGCNIWNMSFYGCFIGGFLIWKTFMKTGTTKLKIIIASIIGCVVTLQMGAFSVVLETMASGIVELPFATFVSFMQPIHLAIGLIEGLITAAVLCFVYEARPELLWGTKENTLKLNQNLPKGKLTYKKTLLVLAILTILIAGGLSLFASTNPDGLEWSIEKVTGSTEIDQTETLDEISKGAQSLQKITALLPDYAFKNSDTPIGTSVSGLVGGGILVAICFGASVVIKWVRKKRLG